MREDRDKITRLYDTFVADGYDMESEDDFRKNMSDAKKRKAAYDALVNDGYEMEPFGEFENNIGYGSPEHSSEPAPMPASSRQDRPQGWNPTEQEKISMLHDLSQTAQRSKQMTDAFHERMDNMREYGMGLGMETKEVRKVYDPESGKFEQTYLTPAGNRYSSKALADAESFRLRKAADMSVSGQLRKANQRLGDLKAKRKASGERVHEKWEEDRKKNTAPLGFLVAQDTYVPRQMNDKENRALDVAIRQTEELIKDLEEQRDREKGKDVGFWRGFGRTMGDFRTWDFGISDMRDAMTMVHAGQLKGEKATEGEREAYDAMMEAIHEKQQADEQYGGNASFWNRAGVMTGYMPSFMLDFAISGGGFDGINTFSKAGAKTAAKVVGKDFAEELAKEGMKSYIRKNGVKGLGKLATDWTVKTLGTTADDLLVRAPLMTNTIQAGKTTADIIDRKLGDVVIDENGNYDFSNDETLGSAIWQGEANAIIENYSEMFGAHLDPVVSLGNMSKLANTFGAKRLGAVLAKADAGALSGIMGQTHNLFNKMGVSDYAGEVAEEYYGQLWRTMLDLDDAYQLNPDGTRTNLLATGRFHGDIWGGMALSMGLMGAGRHAINAAQYVSLKHGVNKADANAREVFGAELWEPLRETIDLTTNENIGTVAESIANDKDMTETEREAALNYMERSLYMRGFNLGTMVNSRGGKPSEEEQQANESYLDGYNATGSQEMNDAKNMLDYQRKRMIKVVGANDESLADGVIDWLNEAKNAPAGSERRQTILDYLNAKQVYDGMIQRVRDDIDGSIEQSDAMIDSRTNRTTGMIQGATMKQDDRKVYVVSGNIAPYEDGTGVDIHASDGSIIVRDAETGTLEQVSPDAVLSVEEAQDPSEQKRLAADAIRLQLAQEAAGKIDGIVPFNPGDTYTLEGEDGEQIQIQVTANGEGIVDNGDGTVNVTDGTSIFQVAKDVIQQAADAANLARVEEFEKRRAAEEMARKQAAEEAAKPQYAMNDLITLRNGNGNSVRGSITADADADGRYEVYTEDAVNGKRVNLFTRDKLDNMIVEHNGQAIENVTRTSHEKNRNTSGTRFDQVGLEEENGTLVSPSVSVDKDSARLADMQVPGAETALERIPKDEQGNPVYEQAETPDLAWDAIVEKTGGNEEMAQTVADGMVADKEAALKKIEKAKPKGGRTVEEKIAAEKERKAAVDAAKQELAIWQKIAQTTKRRKIAAESERRRIAAEQAAIQRAEEEKLRAEREEAERKEREALNGVPDMVDDTPQDARARGYRRVNGHKYDRQAPVPGLQGKKVSVKFGDGIIPTGNIAVIESRRLQPSHIAGQRNPLHFIDEAQPKERNDEASVLSAEKIAGNIRPEEITSSVTAFTGAPTVNARGEAIQGNNRSDALRRMWESHPDQAAKYKQYLKDHADEFGLDADDIEAMERPVLVNMLDVEDSDAITLGQYVAQDTESGGTERIKPKNAVQKMGADMRTFANLLLSSSDEETSFAGLVDNNGGEVLAWMNRKGYITPTQYKSAFDSKGNLTAEAKNDLKGIMYQSIFQNGNTRLEEMFNAMPAKAQRAILATAYRDYDSPNAERMAEEIQNSIRAYHALSQDEAFVSAKNWKEARMAVEAWKRQYAMDDVTGESYLPADKFSNFALHLATMYKGESQSLIQGTFNQLYDLIQGTQEETLFEKPDNTPRTLIQAIKETLNIDYNGQQRSNVLAGDSAAGQEREQGSAGASATGERVEGGKQSTDSGGDVERDSGGSGSNRDGGEGETAASQTKLSKEEAADIIAKMEERAEVAPKIELTIENWDAEFGEYGIVNTPIGDVKMGENQFTKLMRQGRNGKLGMIKPTLENPDIIIEDNSEAKEPASTERKSSYVYVKTFVKSDGSRYYYFTSVTVSKEGHEVVISNQEKRRNVLTNLLLKGKLVWKHADDVSTASDVADGLYSSQGNLSDPTTEGTDAPQTNTSNESRYQTAASQPHGPTSEREVTNSAAERQGNSAENSPKPADNKDEQTLQTAIDAASATEESRQNGLNKRPLLWERGAKDVSSSTDAASASVSTGKSPLSGEQSGSASHQSKGLLKDKEATSDSKGSEKTRISNELGEKIAKAEAEVNTEPTPAQAEAGNYKKGHVTIGGFDITIENPAGSTRKGVDADGKEWSTTMANTYGYIKGTEGVDGDHIDVFLSNDIDGWNGRKAFVVDQTNTDGSFDEHKVMLGFNDKDEAMKAYLANYDATWEKTHPGLCISETDMGDFNKWVWSSHRKTKPFADYSTVRKVTADAPARVADGGDEAYKLPGRLSKSYEEGNENAIKEAENALREHIKNNITDGRSVFVTYLRAKDNTRKKEMPESRKKANRFIAEECKSAMVATGFPVTMFGNARSRMSLASTTDNQEVLDVLAVDDEFNVRSAVVHNPNASDELLGYFIKAYDNNSFDAVAKEILAGRRGNVQLRVGDEMADEMTPSKRVAYNVVRVMLEDAGVPVEVLTDGQMEELAGRNKKAALETDSVLHGEHQRTVISSADGAKVLKNLESLAKKYDESEKTEDKTFIGQVANALGSKDKGKSSQYVTFETKNGKIVTIRLSNHNAIVSNYDNLKEKDGISIVISPKKNKGMTNDGDAHIVEFYYDAIKLRKAENKPLAEIVRSIQQTLYSGEYKDTTGLAQREEVNIAEHIQFLKDGKGVVYGAVTGGKIYLNGEHLNPETPLHEYTHLWDEMVRRENPELWKRGVELMKQTPLWDKVLNDPNYADIRDDEDAVASEVHSRLSGKDGAKLLEEMVDKAKKEGAFATAEAVTLKERIKTWLRDMLAHLKGTFEKWTKKDLSGLTVEEFAQMPLKDLAEGVNPKHGDRTLAGVHNISEEKLLKALRNGGLANPSAAVIDINKSTHTGYGEISLILPSHMVAKRTGRNAGTFSGDAWTPVYPQVERQFGDNGSKRASQDISSVDKAMQSAVRNSINSWMDGRGDDAGLAYLYLHKKEQSPELVYIAAKYPESLHKEVKDVLGNEDGLFYLEDERRKKLLDMLIRVNYGGSEQLYREALQEKLSSMEEKTRGRNPKSMLRKRMEEDMADIREKGYDYKQLDNFVHDVVTDMRYAGTVNDAKTADNAKQYVEKHGLQKDFARWKDELNDRYEVKEVIFDGFTPTGTRRYISNTLENVSRLMKKQGRAGATGFSAGFSNFAARLMKTNGSLDDIRKEKGKLTSRHEDVDAFRDKWSDVYYELGMKLQPEANGYDNYGLARLSEAAQQVDPQAYIKKEYGIDFSDEDAGKLKEMLIAIREEYPAMYFETKFERPVYLNEFASAVVPSDVSDKILSALSEAGLRTFTYNQKKEGDRERVMREAMDDKRVRFQLERSEKERMEAVNERFNEELETLTQENAQSVTLNLGRPGAVLKSAGISDRPIRLYGNKLLKKIRKHGFSISDVKNLPIAINSPIAVFNNYGNGKNRAVLTELKTTNGNALATIEWGKGSDAEINIVTSVFGKGSGNIVDWLNRGFATYIDKEKALEYLRISALNAEAQDKQGLNQALSFLSHQSAPIATTAANSELSSATKVVENFENPALSDEKVDTDKKDEMTFDGKDDNLMQDSDTMYRIRESDAPKKTGTGYKVFVLKNGKLYPPMVANPNGEATPIGVWLDADAAPIAGQSKTGRNQVKAGGKGTQGGSGKLAYRPGWHLGEIPYALQFNRINPETGEKELFPANFVWAEVEYANDKDYQEEAMSYGMNANGKFQHSLAGLPRIPENGSYRYRTNPNPETDPWIITGAMKVNRLLTPSEVDAMVEDAGREPQQRQEGAVTDEQINALNAEIERTNNVSPRQLRKQMAERVKEMADALHLDNVDMVTSVSGLKDGKKRAKGFYTKSTGKITIVIPNHTGLADVEQTLLHEAVAHYGLRQLFGEHFDTFLDNVLNNADESIRHRIVDTATKNGWDFRKATEEYLAGLAERTNFEEAQKTGWWQRIKRFFSDMLDKLGFADFRGVTLSDNELRYILWRSYENLKDGNRNSLFNEAADIAMQYELGVGEYADSPRAVNERFNEELKRYEKGEMDKNEMLHLGMPNGVMRMFLPDLPIVMRPRIINKASNTKHNVDISSIENLPKMISSPIFVFNRSDNKLGILTDAKDRDGLNICVAIELNRTIQDGGEMLEVNDVRSVHGRDEANIIKPIAHNNTLVYADKKKGLAYLSSASSYYQQEIDKQDLSTATKIVENFENPKIGDGNDVLFRDGDPVMYERQLARDRYDKRMKSGTYQSREALQDSLLSVKEAMLMIDKRHKHIEDVEGFENAYLGENRLSSVNQAEADAFAHLLFKPMLEEVARLAKNEAEREELTDYMMAKHGLERNRVMAERDAQKDFEEHQKKHPQSKKTLQDFIGEYRKRDYAGLTALTGMDNVADAEAEARAMVDEYESAHDTAPLWEKVNAVSKAILSKSYECGMMSKETYENVRDMYAYYIPLRGFDEKTSGEAYAYLTHRQSAFNAPIKKAEGRRSKADDPFANLQSMAEGAIMQGNRNRLVKQKFLNFVLNHPSDLVSVSDLWLQYDAVADEWRPVFPDNIDDNDTPDVVEQKMKDFEDRMRQLAESDPDNYKHGKDTANIPYRVVESRDLRQHQVVVKRNGRDYVITVNGNPRLAQALNGQTNPDNDISGAIGKIMKASERVNRHLSAVYTTKNPDFVVSNFVRDMLYTNSMVWIKESPNYALRFHRNVAKANIARMKILLAKHRKGTLDMDKPIEAMFHQFMMNGGETGYTNIRDIEQHKNDIKRELKKANGKIGIRRAMDLLGERFDELNRAVENSARFAAFMTSREMGRTIDRAIYDAKEISVNFNKKGSGAKFLGANGQTRLGDTSAFLSGIGRSSYVFWNAAIQGTANFGRQMKRHPAKALTGAAAMFVLGAVIAYLGGSGDDGDDDDKNAYYNLPEHVRRSNILFRAGNHWISLPLPVEYRALYGMGELMTSVISGKEHLTGGEIASAIAGQATQMLPIDFLEGGGGLNAFVPSAAKPLWEAYVAEKSWTGMPLYKDTPYNKDMPEWTKAYKSANKHIVNLAATLNEMTGGDPYAKGAIDINPTKVEYLLNGYFGGVFGTIDKLTKTGETILGDREYDPRNILLVNRLVKAGDERTEYRAVNNEYFRLKEEHDRVKSRLKHYENDTDNGIFDYAEKIDFLYNSPEYERYEIFEDYRRDIDGLYDELKDVVDNDERKQVEAELNALKKEMIEEMGKTRKRK